MSSPVYLVVGHRAASPGAVGVDGIPEHPWCRILAAQVATLLEARGIHAVVEVNPTTGYGQRAAESAAKAKAAGAVAWVEFHFNADESGKGARSEVLHWDPSPHAPGLAAAILGPMDIAIRKYHGQRTPAAVRATRTNWAGNELTTLKITHCPAVIVESHFGSNRQDHTAATKARDTGELATAIASGIGAWLAGRV